MSRAAPKSHPCPKCNRNLQQGGEMVIRQDGREVTIPVYQCDECLVEQDFAGEKIELALTFAVTPGGQVFDPAEPDGELRF